MESLDDIFQNFRCEGAVRSTGSSIDLYFGGSSASTNVTELTSISYLLSYYGSIEKNTAGIETSGGRIKLEEGDKKFNFDPPYTGIFKIYIAPEAGHFGMQFELRAFSCKATKLPA